MESSQKKPSEGDGRVREGLRLLARMIAREYLAELQRDGKRLSACAENAADLVAVPVLTGPREGPMGDHDCRELAGKANADKGGSHGNQGRVAQSPGDDGGGEEEGGGTPRRRTAGAGAHHSRGPSKEADGATRAGNGRCRFSESRSTARIDRGNRSQGTRRYQSGAEPQA